MSPIYEHRCPACGLEDEEFKPMSEANMPPVCPVCGAQTVRIPSRFGFEIPGFKHGQRIDPDEIGQRSFDRQKYLSEEAARKTPPPPAPPKEPRPAKDLPLKATFKPAPEMENSKVDWHAPRLNGNT